MDQKKQIRNISFVGSGNVATHLALAFKREGLNIVEVYSPTTLHAKQFAQQADCKVVNALNKLNPYVDLILISVPDAKIGETIKGLQKPEAVVAHTSGFSAIEILASAKNIGVFYPLQTFTKNTTIDLSDVPFCIEGNNPETEAQLKGLAEKLSKNVQRVNSEDRRYLHLAAVMVNNFTNHIYHIAGDLLMEKGINFDLLLPLIRETATKIKTLGPKHAQTGPAKRNDISTISEHEQMLSNFPEYRELYRLISAQIKKKYHG